jgi:hypothetical protein
MIEKASPVQMRKSLELVDALKRLGVWFVPVPVLSVDEYKVRMAELNAQLDLIEKEVE